MSEALRLAKEGMELHETNAPEYIVCAQLLRVHAENEALREANEAFGKRQEWWNEKMVALEERNAELVEALRSLVSATEGVSINDYNEETHDIAVSKARAALAKTQGENNGQD